MASALEGHDDVEQLLSVSRLLQIADLTADADAFRVVTGKVDRDGTEFRQLAGSIAEVGKLQAFMASYRDKLANGGLSAIN